MSLKNTPEPFINVIETARNLINNLEEDHQNKIIGKTAIKFYDLEIPNH